MATTTTDNTNNTNMEASEKTLVDLIGDYEQAQIANFLAQHKLSKYILSILENNEKVKAILEKSGKYLHNTSPIDRYTNDSGPWLSFSPYGIVCNIMTDNQTNQAVWAISPKYGGSIAYSTTTCLPLSILRPDNLLAVARAMDKLVKILEAL